MSCRINRKTEGLHGNAMSSRQISFFLRMKAIYRVCVFFHISSVSLTHFHSNHVDICHTLLSIALFCICFLLFLFLFSFGSWCQYSICNMIIFDEIISILSMNDDNVLFIWTNNEDNSYNREKINYEWIYDWHHANHFFISVFICVCVGWGRREAFGVVGAFWFFRWNLRNGWWCVKRQCQRGVERDKMATSKRFINLKRLRKCETLNGITHWINDKKFKSFFKIENKLRFER